MKKNVIVVILVVIAILLSFCGFSQIYTPPEPTQYGQFDLRSKARLAVGIPLKDSLYTNTNDTFPQIFMNRKDNKIWAWSHYTGFFLVGNGSGGGSTGSTIIRMHAPLYSVQVISGTDTSYDFYIDTTYFVNKTDPQTINGIKTFVSSIISNGTTYGRNSIQLPNSTSFDLISDTSGLFRFIFGSNSFVGSISKANITADRAWTMPDRNGELAVLSDIPFTTASLPLQIIGGVISVISHPAFGSGGTASGTNSFVANTGNISTRTNSSAFGSSTQSIANTTFTVGTGIINRSFSCFAAGQWNDTLNIPLNVSTSSDTDNVILQVGDGSSTSVRKNTLTVRLGGTNGSKWGFETPFPTATIDINGSFRYRTGASNGYILTSDANGNATWTAPSGGTPITSISIASSNGLAGSSSGGSTPIITISTNQTGILKGNGTAISAATPGTDYVIPSGNITGSAAKWTTARSITSTGEVSWTVTADGSSNVTSGATISNAAVISKVLTSYSPAPGTVSNTDNILQAIQKLDGNIQAIVPGFTLTDGNGTNATSTTIGIGGSLITPTDVDMLGNVFTIHGGGAGIKNDPGANETILGDLDDDFNSDQFHIRADISKMYADNSTHNTKFGINNPDPSTELDVSGNVHCTQTLSTDNKIITGHTAGVGNVYVYSDNSGQLNAGLPFIDHTGTPTIVVGSGAGTGGSALISTGSIETDFQISVTTGTIPLGSNSTLATVTFPVGFSSANFYPVPAPGNAAAALLSGTTMVFCTGASATTMLLKSGTAALPAGTYLINVSISR